VCFFNGNGTALICFRAAWFTSICVWNSRVFKNAFLSASRKYLNRKVSFFWIFFCFCVWYLRSQILARALVIRRDLTFEFKTKLDLNVRKIREVNNFFLKKYKFLIAIFGKKLWNWEKASELIHN
jgi:hypothetical protein